MKEVNKMNKEIEKAMNRKPREKSELRKWWDKHKVTIMRIVLFPLWLWVIACNKINDWVYYRNKWDEERAKEIFDYYIPRRAEWCADENEFYFFDSLTSGGKILIPDFLHIEIYQLILSASVITLSKKAAIY